MAKKQKNLNSVYTGKKKLNGGTHSIQMEQYIGLKYIRDILCFFKEHQGSQRFSDIIESFNMFQEEYVPDIVFVQLRILKLAKSAQKVEDRYFELGVYGNFLLNNYLSEDPKALLLSAFLIYSVIPRIIYDLNQFLYQKFVKSKIKGEFFSLYNEAKKEAFLELLGIHSKASSFIYDPIPLFTLRTKTVGKSDIDFLREGKPSIKDSAGLIALHYILNQVLGTIKEIYEKKKLIFPYIHLEDLYFYLVRPEVLIEKYDPIKTFLTATYPYSGIFYFLRDKKSNIDNNFENDDINWFLQIFEDIQTKFADIITVNPILDVELKAKLKIPELNYKISLIEGEKNEN